MDDWNRNNCLYWKDHNMRKARSPIKNQDADKVANWLFENPLFFIHYPELLESLKIPHRVSDNVSSFIEYQVKLLNKKLVDNEQQLQQLIHIKKQEDDLNEQLHLLTLELIKTKTILELESVLQKSLYRNFSVDTVALKFLDKKLNNVSKQHQLLQQYFEEQTSFYGVIGKAEQQYLFNFDAKKAKSVVLIKLNIPNKQVIFAIGNKDKEHYQNTQGTIFLQRLAEVIEQLILARYAI